MMPTPSKDAQPPIHRSVSVSWNQADAFRRFTADFGAWWPRRTHSIGGKHVKRIVFDPRVGGLIFEEHADGTRFQWGRIIAFDPPGLVAFTFHSSRDEADSQHVEVRFVPEPTGTRVELVSSGWEKMGAEARRAYGGYKLTWGTALSTYAAQFNAGMLFFKAMAVMIDVTGGRATFIRKSLGRMPASTAQ